MPDRKTQILERQNSDGGWGWRRGGSSWTEPTAYALLALASDPSLRPACDRGFRWLLPLQLPDGGWRPHPTVGQATTVTALAALVPGMQAHADKYNRSIDWLLNLRGRSLTLTQRLIGPIFGINYKMPSDYPGWPFVPGTAPWLVPTSLGILALTRASRRRGDVMPRLESARTFLLSRACRDGGWNHGAARALDIDATSYPETTGLALVALRGVNSPVVHRGIELASTLLPGCTSSEGASWLTMALAMHGRGVPSERHTRPVTTVELALEVLADRAAAGQTPFLETS